MRNPLADLMSLLVRYISSYLFVKKLHHEKYQLSDIPSSIVLNYFSHGQHIINHPPLIMASQIPSQHRALVVTKVGADLEIQTLPTPKVAIGTAICRVLQAGVLSYQREIYSGQRPYPLPLPLVGGYSAVGRIAAVGEDATTLTPGQLVWIDCVIRGRDDPDSSYLMGIHEGRDEGSKKLSHNVWHDGAFAEYMKVPLENCIPLDEGRLCNELGYTVKDLVYLSHLLVAFGGLRDIKVEPGETVIVSPATGNFGGAGVHVVAAMGCRVVAMGRNEKELARIKDLVKTGLPSATIETVKITNDESKDTAALKAFGTIDAALDVSPPFAAESTHIRSAMNAIRHDGRISAMGFVSQPIGPWQFVSKSLMLKGKLMYERKDILQFVKMLERGLFPRGSDFVQTIEFGLDDWKKAFDTAADYTGIGRIVSLAP